jgi:hypothetical protein
MSDRVSEWIKEQVTSGITNLHNDQLYEFVV